MISIDHKDELATLKEILLSSDRHLQEKALKELNSEIMAKIEILEQNANSRTALIQNLNNSKPEIIDVLGPMIGSVIKKGLATEIEKLGARLEKTKKGLTSFQSIKSKLSTIFGFNKNKHLSGIGFPEIKEILLIDIDSGLLLGKFSKDSLVDSDILAGMFSAIKSFSETAFSAQKNGLNLINYDQYKIKLEQYGTIYYAIIFQGRHNDEFDELFADEINTFTTNVYMPLSDQYKREELQEQLNVQMHKFFKESCEKLEKRLSQSAQ